MLGFDIQLDYTEFKRIVLEKKLWWQYYMDGSQYNIFSIDEGIKYNSTIYLSEDKMPIGIDVEKELANKTDFETNYKGEANRPLNLSQSSTTSVFGGKDTTCWGIVDASSDSGYLEWSFTDDLYFNKMYSIIQNAEWAEGELSGDYVTVTVHLPDGTKIKDYSDKIPCWGTHPEGWMQGTGAGKLPAYLKLRITYYKGPNTSNAVRRFAMIPEFLI